LALFLVFLQVRVLEGGFSGGDDRLRQPPDEAVSGRRLHPGVPDQLE
jgi:hypothetical protein